MEFGKNADHTPFWSEPVLFKFYVNNVFFLQEMIHVKYNRATKSKRNFYKPEVLEVFK